jgi:hypothetical protein
MSSSAANDIAVFLTQARRESRAKREATGDTVGKKDDPCLTKKRT